MAKGPNITGPTFTLRSHLRPDIHPEFYAQNPLRTSDSAKRQSASKPVPELGSWKVWGLGPPNATFPPGYSRPYPAISAVIS